MGKSKELWELRRGEPGGKRNRVSLPRGMTSALKLEALAGANWIDAECGDRRSPKKEGLEKK